MAITLKLPLEILREIVREYFTSLTLEFPAFHDQHAASGSLHQSQSPRLEALALSSRNKLDLLRTCHWVYQEWSQKWLPLAHFVFPDTKSFELNLRSLPPMILRRIRQVTVLRTCPTAPHAEHGTRHGGRCDQCGFSYQALHILSGLQLDILNLGNNWDVPYDADEDRRRWSYEYCSASDELIQLVRDLMSSGGWREFRIFSLANDQLEMLEFERMIEQERGVEPESWVTTLQDVNVEIWQTGSSPWPRTPSLDDWKIWEQVEMWRKIVCIAVDKDTPSTIGADDDKSYGGKEASPTMVRISTRDGGYRRQG